MAELSAGVRATLKSLPSVDDLLKAFPPENYRVTRPQARSAIRATLAEVRRQVRDGADISDAGSMVRAAVRRRMESLAKPELKPVLNGTGVVLHTGLGRAPLSRHVLDRAFCALSGYAGLELDLESGKRGERLDIITDLFKALTLSEGVIVVNNNAAAVLLMLNTAADGKEVVVSRGQQVEIGGSFRMPDVIDKSGAQLVEVGTTNRTHLSDYEKAISRQTGALLFVHTSNYRVEGFTKEVPLTDLAALAKKKKVPLLVDLGSGSLMDQPIVGLASEPGVTSVLKTGADLVSFSGDKLLGGPQAGIVVGRKRWLKRLHKNPLYRALRCDKVTLALLEQTLRTYVDAETWTPENLVLELLNRDREELRSQAEELLGRLSPEAHRGGTIKVVESTVEAGSGSLPLVPIPSIALAISRPNTSPDELALRFRQATNPVVGYVRRGQYYIDLKAVPLEKNYLLARTLAEVLAPAPERNSQIDQ
ncbi:MAG: L-seryl-tRNA(Sec) selenium transferase [Fidelibacterota bacterium]|nr:MAG: L-seryl-tRNA(Sec) selenium transferase [Candidatus Neomarinimicrobiota bacterium]